MPQTKAELIEQLDHANKQLDEASRVGEAARTALVEERDLALRQAEDALAALSDERVSSLQLATQQREGFRAHLRRQADGLVAFDTRQKELEDRHRTLEQGFKHMTHERANLGFEITLLRAGLEKIVQAKWPTTRRSLIQTAREVLEATVSNDDHQGKEKHVSDSDARSAS